jgi:predicted nucleotidyltransferase
VSEISQRRLREHIGYRAEWLRGAQSALRADQRAQAVVLHGSLGRGDPDEWSDIDVIVYVADVALPAAVEGRLTFGDPFGDRLYVLDSPWNAPLAGAQVNVLYRLESGLPLYVDWSLWPQSMAALPADTSLLYERSAGLVRPLRTTFNEWATYERQPRPSPNEVGADVLRHAQFGMVPIAVKFWVRRDRERLERLLRSIGVAVVPTGADGEITVIRERLQALSTGETPRTVDAVRTLCDTAADLLGVT